MRSKKRAVYWCTISILCLHRYFNKSNKSDRTVKKRRDRETERLSGERSSTIRPVRDRFTGFMDSVKILKPMAAAKRNCGIVTERGARRRTVGSSGRCREEESRKVESPLHGSC